MTSSHPLPAPRQWFPRLAAALDRRSAPRLALLFLGAVLARGRRTVTSWIRAAGLSDQFRPCYTAVAAAGKKAGTIAAYLVLTVVKPLVSGVERWTLALDDTPTKRYGPHVQGAGVHRNPTPGPATYLHGHVYHQWTASVAWRSSRWRRAEMSWRYEKERGYPTVGHGGRSDESRKRRGGRPRADARRGISTPRFLTGFSGRLGLCEPLGSAPREGPRPRGQRAAWSVSSSRVGRTPLARRGRGGRNGARGRVGRGPFEGANEPPQDISEGLGASGVLVLGVLSPKPRLHLPTRMVGCSPGDLPGR